MGAKPEMKYSTKQVFNKNKMYKNKLIFKQFFKKKSPGRWLFRYSLSIEELIASRIANQIIKQLLNEIK